MQNFHIYVKTKKGNLEQQVSKICPTKNISIRNEPDNWVCRFLLQRQAVPYMVTTGSCPYQIHTQNLDRRYVQMRIYKLPKQYKNIQSRFVLPVIFRFFNLIKLILFLDITTTGCCNSCMKNYSQVKFNNPTWYDFRFLK